jgi:hypothetical protein
MPALDRFPASPAASQVDAEANPMDPRLGNLRLILVHHRSFLDRPAAAGTAVRQWRFQGFVHPGRNGAMGFSTVAEAVFPSRFVRACFGRPFRERRGLPLAGSQSFFQRPAQPFVLSLQLLNLTFQAGDLLGLGFRWHVPAYPPIPGAQEQSRERFPHA